MHDTANSHRAVTAPSNPELFAGALLGRVDAAGILRFLELLPSEAPARGSRTVGVASEFSFTTGAYTYDHGARHGLRQNCRDFPRVTQALNEFMRARAPVARYTTLALFRDLRASVHADKGNDPSQANTLVKLRNFRGGGLWVQGSSGQIKCPLPGESHRLGSLVDFKAGVLQFNAQAPHCIIPWTDGPRVVLVAFTVKGFQNLSVRDRDDLLNLGFQLPDAGKSAHHVMQHSAAGAGTSSSAARDDDRPPGSFGSPSPLQCSAEPVSEGAVARANAGSSAAQSADRTPGSSGYPSLQASSGGLGPGLCDSTAGPESIGDLGAHTASSASRDDGRPPGSFGSPSPSSLCAGLGPSPNDSTAGPESPDGLGSNIVRTDAAQDRPSFLEIFCGTAGLSAAARKIGFRVLGVDHGSVRRANAPVIDLDLRDKECQQRLWPEIRRAHAIWLAPPCGTSSAARGIPLPGSKSGPRPLRTRNYPDGVPHLVDRDAARVASANALYSFSAQVLNYCRAHDIPCVVENPVSSLMWRTSWFAPLVRQKRVHWHELHACMYGSGRKKRTGLLATVLLPGMLRKCDASHGHRPWGLVRSPTHVGFATAEETAYPTEFCRAAARDLQLIMRAKGFACDVLHATDTAAAAAHAQRQARKGRGQVGPPEYRECVLVRVPLEATLPEKVPAKPPVYLDHIPRDSKLLWHRVFLDGGKEVREAEYGVYHTPQEFVQEASKVVHPFDSAVTIDGPNLRAIAYILEHGVKAVEQKRLAILEHYRALAKSLEPAERKLKASMDPQVRKVMGTKRLLLFRQMMQDAGVQDEHLFEDMVNGFRLTGTLPPSGLFPPKYKPATVSVDELRRTSEWTKHLIEGACRKASQDPEVARAVWKESLDQVDRGWLSGPYSWEQMEAKYGGQWVASKRFGVSQGDKVRAVDDLSQFQVNASVTETEKIQLEGLDDIVALARFHLGPTVHGTKSFKLPMANGGVYSGRLHSDFRDGRARLLRGRALDLRSAYKQLARHPKDDWASVLGVLDTDSDRVVYFESLALPFGASSAVTGFNRAARALRIIMSRLFFLVNTSFFDDYCQLEVEALSGSADKTALELLSLLGWEVSSGGKLKPFDAQFTMLGAVVSFEEAQRGLIRVKNKPGRVVDILGLFNRLREDPVANARILPSLKGKLLFASSHVFGRCAQVATQMINHAERQAGARVTQQVLDAVQGAVDMLEASGDRQVNLWSEQPPIMLFTDGACEEEGSMVTHGAVIIDPASSTREFFGGHVPKEMVAAWRSSGRTQLIFFTEIFPVLVARRTWAKLLRNRRVLIFVDNEAAKSALIRNYSPLVDATAMLSEVASWDMLLGCFPWYCRVPSKSNVADAASRLAFGEYEESFRKIEPMY